MAHPMISIKATAKFLNLESGHDLSKIENWNI